jgi:putative ABC transport system permease protein
MEKKGGATMFLALKEMKHAKKRFVMIGAIIMLIAWLVFILSGLGNGLATLSAATMKNLDAEYFVYEEGSEGKIMKTKVSGELQTQILQMENVKATAALGQSTVVVFNKKDDSGTSTQKEDVALLGIEAGNFIEPAVIEGVQLDPANLNGVLVNETLKEDGYKLGDTIKITSSTLEVEIIGFVENETFNHLPVVFSNLALWQSYAFAAPGSENGLTNPVNTIAIQGDKVNAEKLQANLKGVEVISHGDAVMGMPGYKEESGTIYLMLAFLMAISAVIITVFFYVFILQKTQQFGVMKAIGASNSFIKKSIIAQVFVLSLISILVGIALTYLTALGLPSGMPFTLDFTLVVIYAALLLLFSVLGAIISARQVTKIDPLTAIGRVE